MMNKLHILKKLDVEACRSDFRARNFKQAYHDVTGELISEDEVILCALHKARLMQSRFFSKEEKDLSKKWLSDHQYQIPKER